ncbi:MAG: hypothetical protein DHS20C14_12610 [Phycisphaeraceae bacterium]|nr:MAG: hypothetical protein DHS20C14_12610 [Phycisphaeraceae bacterium]
MPARPEHDATDSGGTPARPAVARCVVVVGAGREPEPSLLEALGRHGLTPRVVSSPHAALAELCRRGRERRVLLIADADSVAPARRVMRAAERYAPGAAWWIYEPGANPPLRAFVDQAEESPRDDIDPFAPAEPASRAAGSPMLRLIAADEPLPPIPEGDDAEPTTEHLLSNDELTMLLAEDGKGRRP